MGFPKDPATRQRANVASTRATLPNYAPDIPAPPLPDTRAEWHPLTVDFWAAIWASPMAHQFHLRTDVHGLFIVAELHHRFWSEPNATNYTAYRQAAREWGLTELDRRRLEWRIDRNVTSPARIADAGAARALPVTPAAEDPRRFLLAEKASA